MRKKNFGKLPSGEQASIFTISQGGLTAQVTDFGAALVRLWVPDRNGDLADVVLGYDDVAGYAAGNATHGGIVGRNANRIKNSVFVMNGATYRLTPNEGRNNLHTGPDHYNKRLWNVDEHTDNSICLSLESPNGDQGFPGNAHIRVRYTLESGGALAICYDAVCDRDTVFNMTNHSYFNLAGHDKPERAFHQELILPARVYAVADGQGIPTGEMRSVAGTPMDFRTPKAISRDFDEPYESLLLQHGYDHNYEVYTDPCAILKDPGSGRTMAVSTDCPGVQFYAGIFLDGETGKDGVVYGKCSGICLETQYYPDSINHPEWAQPVTKAGEPYHSQTRYIFK